MFIYLSYVKKINFNKYDLYSKGDSTIISDEIKRYYNNLLNDFFPDTLNW